MVGRALELAGTAKRGKGTKQLDSKELKRAPQFIRDGIGAKKAQRTAQQIEEVCLPHMHRESVVDNSVAGQERRELPPHDQESSQGRRGKD